MDKQNMDYPNNGMLFTHKKWNDILFHATMWMNLENIMLSVRSQTQKATYCMYVEPRKMVQMSQFAGQKLRHRCREWTYGQQGGKTAVGWGWWCAELGDWD